MPETTAVIFVCNRHAYFHRALASALSQSTAALRVLVSDCSDDPAARKVIIEAYERLRRKYPRVRTELLLHPSRLRQYRHIEAVLRRVDTEFVALLDDDDRWLPHHVSTAVDWLRADRRRGLHVADAIVERDGTLSDERVHSMTLAFPAATAAPAAWEAHVLKRALSSTSGLVFRTSALGDVALPDLPLVDVHLAWHVAARHYFVKADRTRTFVYTAAASSFHQKGEYNFYERHLWRMWLARRSGVRITTRVPIFPLLVLKSAVYLLRRKMRRSFVVSRARLDRGRQPEA